MKIEQAYINYKSYLMFRINKKFYSLNAEDIVQDLFCSLKQENLDKVSNKLAYLTQAAYYKAIDQLPKVIDHVKETNKMIHINKLRTVKSTNRVEKLALQMMIKGQSYKQITNILKMNYRLNLKKDYVRRIVWVLNKRAKESK